MLMAGHLTGVDVTCDGAKSLGVRRAVNPRTTIPLALSVTAVLLAGCGTPPPRDADATAKHVPAVRHLADFAQGPEGDPVYECIRSTVETQYGVFAMQSGMASDDGIAAALVGSLPDSVLRRQREAEGALWRQTHDPNAVAKSHLEWCVGTTRVPVDSPTNIRACLQLVEPAVLFSLARTAGRSPDVALEGARSRYHGFLSDDQLTLLSRQVFALATRDADIRFRAARFAECLRAQ
jgi:hypothetical protein